MVGCKREKSSPRLDLQRRRRKPRRNSRRRGSELRRGRTASDAKKRVARQVRRPAVAPTDEAEGLEALSAGRSTATTVSLAKAGDGDVGRCREEERAWSGPMDAA